MKNSNWQKRNDKIGNLFGILVGLVMEAYASTSCCQPRYPVYGREPAKLTPNGQRRRKIFDNMKAAEEIARRLKRGLENKSMGFAEPVKQSGLLFKDVVKRWLQHEEGRVRTLKKRASSLGTDQHRLKSLLRFFGIDDLHNITSQRIVDYQAFRLEEGRSASTVNGEVLGGLMKVLHWAKRNKLLDEMPFVEPIPEEVREVDVPTMEEISRLINVLPEAEAPLIWFMAETGCRSGEVFNIVWDDVDEVIGIVKIRPKGGWTPKTKQSRRDIHITGQLLEAIRAIQKKGPYVFPSRINPDKPRNDIRKVLATGVRKADITRRGKLMHITPHVLRKAYATWQATSGTAPRVLQALLGHAPGSNITDRHYVQATEDAKRKAASTIQIRGPLSA